MITVDKKNIEKWIALNNDGGTNKEVDEYFSKSRDNSSLNSLQIKLLEAKVLIDRWDQVSTDIIFHSSKKDFVREQLASQLYKATASLTDVLSRLKELIPELDTHKISHSKLSAMIDDIKPEEQFDHIWGATIHYSDDCPENVGIMLATVDNELYDEEDNSRSIAVFPM